MWYNPTTAQIGNEMVPGMKKDVYLLVDYKDRVPGRAGNENIVLQVLDPDTGLLVPVQPTSITASQDDGQLLFTWLLDFQPAWENILFPDNRYNTLAGNVEGWDVSTICVPEPGGCVLLITAGISVLLFAWRRRKWISRRR